MRGMQNRTRYEVALPFTQKPIDIFTSAANAADIHIRIKKEFTMNKRHDGLWRYIIIGAFFIAVCVVYAGLFVDLQLTGQDYYSTSSSARYTVRSVKLQAQRGEIYDRNGKLLVGNVYSNDIRLDYGSMPRTNSEKNNIILALVEYLEKTGESEKLEGYRYTPFEVTVSDGILYFEYCDSFFETTRRSKYEKLASELNISEDADADSAALVFMKYYGICDGDGTLSVSPESAMMLFYYRTDLEMCDFSAAAPYTFASDVSLEYIAMIKEAALRGYTVYCRASRSYNYPGYASHLLGRIQKIPAADAEYYTELGYPLDAYVGTSGAEYAFEEYLHGTDGELLITEDAYGNIISTEVKSEPIAGLDVYLTIDIGMQMAAEDSLAYNIAYVRDKAAKNEGEHDGEDAAAGALTAVDPKNGEVLVLASYPTYDLSTYLEDLEYLNADESAPLLNRALNGTYQPGSTFKPGVAVAALDAGIITPYTIIETKGKYEYYSGYQPRCWIYLMYNRTHGNINVTEALQESCNYFFYDIGRQLTIETLNSYMSSFGLGQPTGIELPEQTGVLAGPEYREENGLEPWAPGDTLQAAIGQSDNLFSPLQMSMYVTTLVNDGTRYSAHLLLKACDCKTGDVVHEGESSVISTVDVSAKACQVVRNAMRDVIENGSASELFDDYPITIGGKTGTAQVSSLKSDNAIFTAFAPFEDPEYVVTCVIEQGNTGANAGVSVKGVFDYCFGLGDYGDADDDADTDAPDNGGDDGEA